MMSKVAVTWVVLVCGVVARGQEAGRGDAYFPLVAGTTWTYRVTMTADGRPPHVSEQVVSVEPREHEGKAVTLAGETAYAAKDDGVYVVGVVRSGKVELLDEAQKVVPAEPKLGDKWTYREAAGVTSATCLGIERVKVGAGEYDAVKVYLNTVGGAGQSERREVYRWFAKGVGPVKGMVTERRLGQDGSLSTREIVLALTSVRVGKAAGEVATERPAATGSRSATDLFTEGETLARKGQHREAVAKYDAAIAADARLAKAHAYKALSLMSTRDLEGAERAAGRAVSMDPKDYTFQEIAGQVKVAQGRIAEGKALYERAATMSPPNAGAVYTDLAAVLAARKEERLAGEIDAALKRAAAAEPPSAEALFALGQSYVNGGRVEGKGYLQRYIEVASRLPEGKRDETKIRLARQLIRAIDAVKGTP